MLSHSPVTKFLEGGSVARFSEEELDGVKETTDPVALVEASGVNLRGTGGLNRPLPAPQG